MKQMIGSALAVLTMGYVIYAFAATDSCERIYRSTGPVRAVFNGVRWLGANYLSQEARLRLILWSVNTDAAAQRIVGRTTMGPDYAKCGA